MIVMTIASTRPVSWLLLTIVSCSPTRPRAFAKNNTPASFSALAISVQPPNARTTRPTPKRSSRWLHSLCLVVSNPLEMCF
jgi:hypothetical protein